MQYQKKSKLIYKVPGIKDRKMFSAKGQIVKVFGFSGHMASTTQLSHCTTKASMDTETRVNGYVAIKLHLLTLKHEFYSIFLYHKILFLF